MDLGRGPFSFQFLGVFEIILSPRLLAALYDIQALTELFVKYSNAVSE